MITSLSPAPLPSLDSINTVFSGKVVPLGSTGLLSGINKTIQLSRVPIGDNGIIGDQREYYKHQGTEKGLHQYCSAHYPLWTQTKPSRSHMFRPGAFGENISTSGLNESNMCIGDIFTIGPEVVAQVTEPRTPCYKLNARFDWPQVSRKATKTGRVGWYLRVLKTGTIGPGDEMRLVQRINPKWSVLNASRVLASPDVSTGLIEEMVGLKGLGEEIQEMAEKRLRDGPHWGRYRVREARELNGRIRELTFTEKREGEGMGKGKGSELPPHAYVQLRFGEKMVRSYSVVDGTRGEFRVAIALAEESRGGSEYLHKKLKVGDEVEVQHAVVPTHEVERRGKKRVFVFGGIGITAFLREIKDAREAGEQVEAHYAVRSMADAVYREELGDGVKYYAKDEGKRLTVSEVIRESRKSGSEGILFVCGPDRMMDECKEVAKETGWPEELTHFESFGGEGGGKKGDAFEVVVKDGEKDRTETFAVPENKSLLNILEDAGFDVPSNCRSGMCGMCVVGVCGGQIIHNGDALRESEKDSAMLSCVSRGKGKIEIEIE